MMCMVKRTLISDCMVFPKRNIYSGDGECDRWHGEGGSCIETCVVLRLFCIHLSQEYGFPGSFLNTSQEEGDYAKNLAAE